MNKILLLINTGSPDSPDRKDVRRYLRQFLTDKRVVQLPWLLRQILVNMIIVPFRAGKSARLYNRLWTSDGSPLKHNMNELIKEISKKESGFDAVYDAMRYGNPSISETLKEIKSKNPERIVVMPLFPHYTAATTGSAIEEVKQSLRKLNYNPDIEYITEFYNHPLFISIISKNIENKKHKNYDHIIFSYHGLPLKNIKNDDYELKINNIKLNYAEACHETTRLISEKLNLMEGSFTTTFQSRMGRRWLAPFADEVIKSLAMSGIKRVLVVAPSFVADCLETTIEIEQDYNEMFKQHGGEELTMVQSLNHSTEWADAIPLITKSPKNE